MKLHLVLKRRNTLSHHIKGRRNRFAHAVYYAFTIFGWKVTCSDADCLEQKQETDISIRIYAYRIYPYLTFVDPYRSKFCCLTLLERSFCKLHHTKTSMHFENSSETRKFEKAYTQKTEDLAASIGFWWVLVASGCFIDYHKQARRRQHQARQRQHYIINIHQRKRE